MNLIQLGLINGGLLISIKNDITFNININNIQNNKNNMNIFNLFKHKKLNNLLDYYKVLICYIYLNSKYQNNEYRLYYSKEIEKNKSIINPNISCLCDIKFKYFSINIVDDVNYFIINIDKSFEKEIKKFIINNNINSNEQLLNLLKIYMKDFK